MGGGDVYTVEQALQKIRHYCAYQERSHAEVRMRLGDYHLTAEEVELVISSLIQDDYLNEQRFCTAFAGGKFRTRQWGRLRIRYELKRRGVSEYNIEKGLDAIGPEEYQETLNRLAEKKWKAIKGSAQSQLAKKQRVLDYLQQKGYEPHLIREILKGQDFSGH